ncbi:uncharacterized protein fusl isoform X3 [Prorops nasuta]
MVIGCWRGGWVLMDAYPEIFPEWPSFALGTGLHTIFAIFKELFHENCAAVSKKSVLLGRALQVLYIYVFGVSCMGQWRGGWILLDARLIKAAPWAVGLFTCTLVSILMFLRSIRNLVAPPFVICIDNINHVYMFPTRYKKNTRDWSLYILDCAFSVGVIGTLVVFVWRGVWILVDLYVLPEDRETSAVSSLVIGYVIVGVTFCLQPLMRYVCATLEGLPRLIAADAFLLLSFLGTVNVWRGIWNVLDLWLLPENPKLSCWITHVGCFAFLVLLNCSNSILVRGVYIDAEEDKGKCVVFPCHYLRLFFKVEREKKEARRRNLLLASRDFTGLADLKDAENGVLLANSTNPNTVIPANPESLV